MEIFLCHIFSFFIGSIPVGYLVGKIKGIDVRREGSGNTGATNICRTVGKKAGLLTLLGDALKGAIAVSLGYFLQARTGSANALFPATAGLASIAGHCFSPFLKFRGGKGVATSLGAFLMLAPLETLLATGLFLAVLKLSGFVSLGSITAAVAFPVLVFFLHADPYSAAPVSLVASLIVVFRHKQNIARLLAGTESKFKL